MLYNSYFLLSLAALAPAAVAVLLFIIEKYTKFGKLNYWIKQTIFGIVFGFIAILGTHFGIEFNGSLANVRDASVIIGGLVFGWPAGIIAGLIGGIERYFGVYWFNIGSFTQIACSVSTIIAGLASAALRKFMFEDKRCGMYAGTFLTFVIEVFHLLMVFITNNNDYVNAYIVIHSCTIPMLLGNSLSVFIAILLVRILDKGKNAFEKIDFKSLTRRFQRCLTILIFVAFVLSTAFLFVFENNTANAAMSGKTDIVPGTGITEAILLRNIQLYINTFLEIVIFGLIYILLYFLVKKLVTDKLERTNKSLKIITDGNLDEVVKPSNITEFNNLSDGINHTVTALKGYINEKNKRMQEELAFAKAIQTNVLPSTFPAFPNRHEFDVYATMHTAKEVGGDFYDFYYSDTNKFNITIADVSGKGIPASLFMMRAKQELKSLTQTNLPINKVFEKANNNLNEGNDAGMFVTTWEASIDLESGELSYVNGGHNFPLIKRANGKFEYLRCKPNMVLAVMEDLPYRKNDLQLEKGDIIFLYTDGVTEAVNKNLDQFSEDRLLNALNSREFSSCKEICEQVYEVLINFVDGAEQFDDITMLAFKYNGKE